LAEAVEGGHVGKHVVDVVTVGRVHGGVPDTGVRVLLVDATLSLRLIIDRVETNDSLKEDVKVRVARGVLGDLEQGLEDVLDDLLKVLDRLGGLVDVVQTRDLDQPTDVRREQLVVDHPVGQLVPLVLGTTIDRDTVLGHLVLALLQIRDDFSGNVSKVASLNLVVRLHKDLTETGLADRVVLQVELVEPVERVLVSL
jgi:hypothetical protein